MSNLKNYPISLLHEIPDGSLVEYRNKIYFLSDGLENKIVTDTNGHWLFINGLEWKEFRIVYLNEKYK